MGSVSRGLHVVATTDEGTRRALVEASRLCNGSKARVLLLVPHEVSYFGPQVDATEALAITDRYRALASTTGVEAIVRLCVCRHLDDVFRWLLGPGAQIVIGGRQRWWWPTAAERLAWRLRRRGHDVVFANV